ncbi:hypothetical protein [Listeria goaensis]|uniref:hypothetical protein n=1 Tax=Listeria goaensis TaxID=1649188 RepID=UPI000B596486|nr:hypothetical protein [Listeria goaensis]
MSRIKLNEAAILQSTRQFSGKQSVLYKKTAPPMRKNQLESSKKMNVVLHTRMEQLKQVQQFGEKTTQDIETNCAEFVQMDQALLDKIEITG